jgi:DNA-binding helix-turn-helix protein
MTYKIGDENIMTYSEEIKKIRQKCFLSQEAFGREIGVSFSSINRCECRKSKPNMSAMKKIKEFCEEQNIDFKPRKRME